MLGASRATEPKQQNHAAVRARCIHTADTSCQFNTGLHSRRSSAANMERLLWSADTEML